MTPGVVVVEQYPGVQVYNNYAFKSSEQPVSFALTATNTHPSTLPVIRTVRVCLCHYLLSLLFQIVSTCLQLGHIGFHWYMPTIDLLLLIDLIKATSYVQWTSGQNLVGTSYRLPSSQVPFGTGRRGGNSHLPMAVMSSPTESQWDVSSLMDTNFRRPSFCSCLPH